MGNSKPTDPLPAFITKVEAEGLPPLVSDTFAYYYKQVLTGGTGIILDRDIRPVCPLEIGEASNLNKFTAAENSTFKY